MSKIKLLTVAVLGLLVVNLGMVAYLFLLQPHSHDMPERRPQGHRHEGPRRIIIERLHFDEGQVAQYEELIHDHRAAVRNLDQEIHDAKNALYSSLGDDRAVNIDSLQNNIARLQKDLEVVHYQHFIAIKELCRSNQQQYFNDLAKDLANFFNPRRKPGKDRP